MFTDQAKSMLDRVAAALCRYWDGLDEGADVGHLVDAMKELRDVTAHKGLSERLRTVPWVEKGSKCGSSS